MRGKCLMIQGTASSVGKSVLCAALLRILKQDGLRVAPFKAQNMALNSFVTKDGREMGRAQVTQAQAAGMEPDVRMNPVLLKPTGDRRSQVIIEGRAVGSMTAMEYHAYKPALRQRIKTIYDSLEREVDCVVIEGAGSPAEINLREGDIVNMSMAEAADAPVLLVGDIDLGGVYRVSDHSGGSMMFRLHMEALAAGFLLDLLLGDPEWLYHPVRLIGRYIAWMEKRLRQRGRNLRRSALWLTATTVLGTMAVVALILGLVGLWGRIPLFIAMALLDWMGIAVTSMAKEARAVGRALPRGIFAARKQVSRIVGRDTQYLSEREIICATVETVAENTTDGVISPMFYAFLGGPILLWGFKAASTLDSMVGYMNEKYRDIGWSSARLDDILNYLPARLTAGLMVCAAFLTGLDGRNAARIVWRDHANHSSPNCAWSEAAAAGALHIRLGGTHNYFGKPVYKPTIGDADRPPQRQDIRRANRLLYVTSLLMMAILCLIFIISGGASI